MAAKVLDHNNHSLLTAVLKKNFNFQYVLWASSSIVLLAWNNYLLILKIREIIIIIISLLNPLVVYNTKIQGRSRIRRTHNYTWHRRQKQFNPIITVGNKIPKAVRSDKAEFRMGNLGEQGCLSMLGINHSTHRTSITFCHKLPVNKLLNLPHQETSAATGFSVPVTQPSQKFWSPPPHPSPHSIWKR